MVAKIVQARAESLLYAERSLSSSLLVAKIVHNSQICMSLRKNNISILQNVSFAAVFYSFSPYFWIF